MLLNLKKALQTHQPALIGGILFQPEALQEALLDLQYLAKAARYGLRAADEHMQTIKDQLDHLPEEDKAFATNSPAFKILSAQRDVFKKVQPLLEVL